MSKLSTADEFERLLALPPTDACVLWTRGRIGGGYGMMTDPTGRRVNVHVRALERTVGPRPDGCEAAHLCRSRHCMNPRHLRWATRSENSRDRHRDGTCWQAKLTPDQVRDIRARADRRAAKQADLAKQYGVSINLIEYIKARKVWEWLPEETTHVA